MLKRVTDATSEQREMWRAKAKAKKQALFAQFYNENPHSLASYLKMVPKTYKWLWYSCFSRISSKPGAIKAKCLDCSGYDRSEVVNCQVRQCPLWRYRPYVDAETQD